MWFTERREARERTQAESSEPLPDQPEAPVQ